MRKIGLNIIVGLATMLGGTSQSWAAMPTPETFYFDKSGIAAVKVGEEYDKVPASYPGLYSHAAFQVGCNSEDGENVSILYYDEDSDDILFYASLNVDQSVCDAIQEEELYCNTIPFASDSRIKQLLQQSGGATIRSITVSPTPIIAVSANGQWIATCEPAAEFMNLPNAVSTVSLGEGLYVSCTVGNLHMVFDNGYEALTPEAMDRVGPQVAAAMETGVFSPIPITAADITPDLRFESFTYLPEDSMGE